ncbi:RodZ domain-containing protein [Actinomadura sp. WMMB 499]|uniref:RodZ domain-containing protein n=1 Tax=Actinomadura sp. WMMB 499 TaxID=1219491 RepID=UPI0020C80F2D|nr:RodZ domain-containing protein [Actinomadura sp. WMMB 499]
MAAVLALLVVGGMALVNAVSGEPDQPGPSASASAPAGGAEGSPSPSAGSASQAPALLIRVTGPPTDVYVRIPAGEVLFTGTMATGETYRYDEAPLDVVAANGSALEVAIYGEPQDPKPAGRAEWSVPQNP